MSFELATYGLVASLLYKKHGIYKSLIVSMISGRLVWGIVMAIISGVSDVNFGLNSFIMIAFVNAIPAIIIQIILIPIIINIINKRRYEVEKSK